MNKNNSYHKLYYKDHIDEIREYQKEYKKLNKYKIIEYHKERYICNKTEILERQKKYNSKNLYKIKQYQRSYYYKNKWNKGPNKPIKVNFETSNLIIEL